MEVVEEVRALADGGEGTVGEGSHGGAGRRRKVNITVTGPNMNECYKKKKNIYDYGETAAVAGLVLVEPDNGIANNQLHYGWVK